MLEILLHEFVFTLLLLLIVGLAVVIIVLKNLLHAVIVAGVYGVLLAVVYYILQAPDIALTQIVVGVGIQTAIFIAALYKTSRVED